MAKISVSNVLSGFNLDIVNANFQKIAAELNNNVLYRDNPDGEPNQFQHDLDANGYKIYNLSAIRTNSLYLNGVAIGPETALVAIAPFQEFEYTATAGQTIFSVSPYEPLLSSLEVYVNGFKYPPSDVNISTTNVILPAMEAGDEVVVKVYLGSS